jgi:hypothetical protein
MSITMSQVRAAQPEWFSRKNKRFFGDVGYKVLTGKQSRKPYLVRSTFAWTDMFGQPRTLHYRVNTLDTETLHIGGLVDKNFRDMDSLREWLRGA